MIRSFLLTFVLILSLPVLASAQQASPVEAPRLKVFLDCEFCFQDFIRSEVDFVEYVRDRVEADVHVIVTSSTTGSGGRERAVSFIGAGRFAGMEHALRSTTEAGEPEDSQRRSLASVITVGLLNYQAQEGLGRDLTVSVRQNGGGQRAAPMIDRWNNWVMSLRGSVSVQAEESSREIQLDGQVGADRVTDAWKITTGVRFDHSREDFDLDEDEPFRATRDEREIDWLVVRSVNDHWSIGTMGQIESSSFENLDWTFYASPAVEFNVFPYSAYTRRQLRANYSVGPYRASYVEETLFFKMNETLGRQEASVTLDQREPWGSVQVRFEASNFLPGIDRHRLEVEGELSLRIARGLSFSVEGSTARLRDQLALPRRGATPEEVLLRVRRLRSGYEYDLQVGLTYTFGSIFNTIVNPRFGQ
jgi:hypothetical protein